MNPYQVYTPQDALDVLGHMVDELIAEKDAIDEAFTKAYECLEQIEDGCCEKNHPPALCDCAEVLARKTLKELDGI